ncbi:MAG: TlpA disulfide reductase family protein [Pikeienuella sp.]
MRAPRIITAILYAAVVFGASPAAADLSDEQIATIKAARSGDMKKLVIHEFPRDRLETSFQDANDAATNVAAFGGKITVLNFWATWCPPCRKEMPSLDRLQAAMADSDIQVLAISMDRASVEKIDKFFNRIDAHNLAIYRDPSLRLGQEAGVLGLPVTLILDREGREIGRLQGDAEWDAPETQALLKQIAAME